MARTLRSADRYRQRLDAIVGVGVAQVGRTWAQRSFRALAAVLSVLQHEAAVAGLEAVEEMLDEQEIDAPAVATPIPSAFAGHTAAGADISPFLEAAASLEMLEQAIVTEIADAARIAEQTSIITRTDLYGYIRVVNTATCCGRCAVLAGRFYRWSDGFLRHPNCMCMHIPVLLAKDLDIKQSPEELFAEGRIHDLTKAETDAIEAGADISQVINIRRKAAGLRVAGRILERGNRLTVEGIMQIASDREETIELLERFGYVAR